MQTPLERDAHGERTYGLPPQMLQRAWRIEDIAGFLGIGLSKARDLMKQPAAPRRLRMASERCDRWNAAEVLAWLHHEDEHDEVADRRASSPSADFPAPAASPLLGAAFPLALPAPRATGLMATPRRRRAS